MKKLFENWRSYKEEVLSERINLKSDKERELYARLVYEAYKAAPSGGNVIDKAYEVLKKSNATLFKRLKSKIEPNFTDNYDDVGYKDANDMSDRITKDSELNVDKRYSDNHPYFTPEENWIFRTVHDYYTHHLRGKKYQHAFNFDLKGEIQTYNTHANIAPKAAIPALFCEVVCQLSYEQMTGGFPDPQKAALVKGIDFIDIGNIACGNNNGGKMVIGRYEDNFGTDNMVEYFKNNSDNPEHAIKAYKVFCK